MNGIARIQQQFASGKVFAGFLTAGDGGLERTLQAALALVKGGVNLLEIGLPFSDPIADGPTIQQASQRALSNPITLADILSLTTAIRAQTTVPIILFGYFNPLLAAASRDPHFFETLIPAGIDGVLIVDCPLEESGYFQQQLSAQQLALIYVITPVTPLERVNRIDKYGSGFLYYACRVGTTGTKSSLPVDFIDKVELIRTVTHHPLLTGFGISSLESAKQALQYTDGVVVGSLFVDALANGKTPAELTDLASQINPLRYIS